MVSSGTANGTSMGIGASSTGNSSIAAGRTYSSIADVYASNVAATARLSKFKSFAQDLVASLLASDDLSGTIFIPTDEVSI